MARRALPPALAGLEPKIVWKHFADLLRIPRCSGNEAGVRAHLEKFAKSKHLKAERDDAGNLLLRVRPEAPGPVVCLQGHMDMVGVAADGVQHDWTADPVTPRRDGDFIYAEGTTLGADNGIGLAFAMAMVDEQTGPLEILCTVDEEVGLTGASAMKPNWLQAKFLVNLDSEEESSLTVACSGGRDMVVTLPWPRAARTDGRETVAIRVKGLRGGHSGIDINKGRSNANQVLGRVLAEVARLGGALHEVAGGVKRNAIAPNANAVVSLPAGKGDELKAAAEQIQRECATASDPDLSIETAPGQTDLPPVAAEASERLVRLLEKLPHGVLKSTSHNPDLPFVSINLALINVVDDKLTVIMSGRSPVAGELDALETRARAIAAEHGATFKTENGYPGWAPNYDSPLLAITKRCYEQQFGRPPTLLEIHAGLECGIIGSKHPGLDMISIGPDLHNPHSPQEHVSISSAQRMYKLVKDLVAELQRS
ncbi:MAG: beta-Ala-His dipeptidase [Deltaproteobacteria bacterium]|nr:beta-Ala-His dipeptidase [Deltaproteobacteria bacterium]